MRDKDDADTYSISHYCLGRFPDGAGGLLQEGRIQRAGIGSGNELHYTCAWQQRARYWHTYASTRSGARA